MSLAPIELFYVTTSIMGHSLAYITLFPLFLLFKSEKENIFLLALLLAISITLIYYTASIVIILCSIGFIIALIIKEFIQSKKLSLTIKNSLKNKKIRKFLIIAIILILYLSTFANMLNFSIDESKKTDKIKGTISKLISPINNKESAVYKDPTFFKLSAIRWQMLFFFLCGLTFILYLLIKKDFSEKNIDILLCLIPIIFVSIGFFYVNLPTRIFNYFAFFGILALKIPKKYIKAFAIISFIFIIITSVQVANNKTVFLTTNELEIQGAKEISQKLNGKIFSDQFFVNQLILNNYYNITGADDNSPVVHNLFYQDNEEIFKESINYLNQELNVEYIAITKRMREQYILMLNYPQKSIKTRIFFRENLEQIYNNGDVEVYKTK